MKEKESRKILSMTSVMTLAERHELQNVYDMRAFIGQLGDFVDGDQDFLTVALQLPSLPPNQFPCYQISELKPTMCLTYGHVHGKTKHLHSHQNKFLVNCKRTHANHIAILIYWAV